MQGKIVLLSSFLLFCNRKYVHQHKSTDILIVWEYQMIKNNVVVERISENGNELSEKFYCQNLKPMIRLPSILPTELMASFYSLLWSTCILNQTKEQKHNI